MGGEERGERERRGEERGEERGERRAQSVCVMDYLFTSFTTL